MKNYNQQNFFNIVCTIKRTKPTHNCTRNALSKSKKNEVILIYIYEYIYSQFRIQNNVIILNRNEHRKIEIINELENNCEYEYMKLELIVMRRTEHKT